MNLRFPLILSLCLAISGALFAQPEPPRRPKLPSWLPQPPERPVRVRRLQPIGPCANVLTVNFPTYMHIGGYPGVVVGLEYERFLDSKGSFSASLSLNRYWAGTNASGRLRTEEVRANIQGAYFMPGIFYHPAGNDNGVDLSIGAVFPLGSVRRQDVTSLNSSYYSYSERTTNTLAAILCQVNMSIHTRGHFVFTTYLSGGPMLTAANTHGALLLIGMKMGGRF